MIGKLADKDLSRSPNNIASRIKGDSQPAKMAFFKMASSSSSDEFSSTAFARRVGSLNGFTQAKASALNINSANAIEINNLLLMNGL